MPALIFGVAVGNVLQGVPFHFTGDLRPIYGGGLLGLLNPLALLCGGVSLAMLVAHGAAWLAFKAEGPVAERARAIGMKAALVTAALFTLGGLLVWAGAFGGYRVVSPLPGDGPSNPLAWPQGCAETETPDWLVFSAMLIASKRDAGDPGLTPESTSLEEEGFPTDLREALVESFARHLTKAFEIWSEDGAARSTGRYLARLALPPGARATIDPEGDARLVHADGRGGSLPLLPALVSPTWRDPATGSVRL